MVEITQINIIVKTGNIIGAGTDGRVYLGIGGREFKLDKPGNQFEKGNSDTFTIGTGSNIENTNEVNSLPTPNGNTNSPNIEDIDIEFNPKYIRFDPSNNDDNWNVENVQVEVVDIGRTYGGPRDGNIWLGSRSGLFLGLK